MSPDMFRDLLFSLSGLSFGAAFYALGVYSLVIRRSNLGDAVGYVMVKGSWLMTVGMVFVSIIVPMAAIEPTWQGWVYALGLVCGTIGFLLIARAAWRTHLIYEQVGPHRRATDEKPDDG